MSETALSAIAQINPGARIPKEITGSDEVSFIPMSDVSESGDWTTQQTRPLRSVTAGFTAFEEGDVLVAKITPCLENGKGAHARGLRNGIGFGSTEFHVLRARQGVDPRFVFHITQSRRFRQAAERQMVGSAGQQRVQRQFFDEFLVRDFSSDEQIAIAQILDTLDIAIRETEALIDKLKAVKQGLLHDLLTRGIDASGQLRPPQSEAPQLYKESPLGWIPREWGQTSTRDLCSLITKGTTPAAANMWQGGEGIRFLRVDNLSFDGRFDFEASDFRVSLRTHQGELSRSICLPGDVLTNIVGPPLGKLGLVTAQIGEVNINQAIALFRPRLTLLSGFLLLWLGSLPAQTWLRKRAKQTSGQVNLTLALCQELPIPEISLEEQQLIVDRIAKVHERLSMEAGELGKLYSTKSGLMDDLLTGRVRVTPLLESVPQPAAPTGA
ncbi:restriction endonuclease subunit S [Azotobacter chroococcum]|uniref:restriction endonuclease subunit S n=1 Tax=Azotobacter chroococcum TaxID=353 RepID=UPI001039CB7B|nr:restriction endonuclease subunit S [Azotobacter chroococcum]TBW08714.1 restriction endonuclease subunit S [Azotobacter chroococcum]